MKLRTLVKKYIVYGKAIGKKFNMQERHLKAFGNFVGNNTNINDISSEKITQFLYGNTEVTLLWFIKHSALKGFYQYALGRGYINSSPLPTVLPKKPRLFIPYIYSRIELKEIFKVALTYQKRRSHVESFMIYSLLLVLYGTGMRIGEALSLTMTDVDLDQAVITIKEGKCYKSRLIPFGVQLSNVINAYVRWRNTKIFPKDETAPFFYGRHGKSLNLCTTQTIFRRICEKANVKRTDGGRFQPRLHDLRHTFAVHRLINWYQKNEDVQQLLPLLSTYMGHTCLSATLVYLTMTGDLLKEAGKRFEEYARGNHHEK
jgi:site-specific recombinase XerD